MQDDLADALEKALRVLQVHRKIGEQGWEGDVPVKASAQYSHASGTKLTHSDV